MSKRPISRTCWIWYPENAPVDAVNQSRYFRKTVHLDEEIASAEFRISADDRFRLFVNGKACTKKIINSETGTTEYWMTPTRFDVREFLVKGDNVIAIVGGNGASYAGIIMLGKLVTANGRKIYIHTDNSWKVSKTSPEGWKNKGFDDSKWQRPLIIGDATAAPWSALGMRFNTFLTPAELEAWQKDLDRQIGDLSYLDSEPIPNAKIIYKNKRPFVNVNGKDIPPMQFMVAGSNPFDTVSGSQISGLVKAGVKILDLQVRLDSVWTGSDTFYYHGMDNNLKKLTAMNRDGYLIVSIRLDAPQWWLRANSEELTGYATGPIDSDEQLERYKAASMASEPWRRDTTQAIRNIIRHLSKNKWSKRIIGYRTSYGIYNEWHYYGMRGDMPDTGKAMTKRFRRWLEKKYNNDVEALRAAWQDREADFETASVPGVKERQTSSCMILRIPEKDTRVLDYYSCMHDVIAETLLGFTGATKEETERRLLAGAYYGYFFGMGYPPEGFHLNFDQVLASPDIDFLSSPYSYDKRSRAPGGDGLCRSIPESFRLHGKLLLLEDDTRTHLSGSAQKALKWSYTEDESVGILTRQMCSALIHGHGIQWLEFGTKGKKQGWLDSPGILSAIGKTVSLYNDTSVLDSSSCSEVCVVVSPDNVKHLGYAASPVPISYNLLSGVVHELGRTGAPFDIITMADIENENLPDYKLYIFPNAFYLSEQERKVIEKTVKRDGKAVIWLYASGAIAEDEISDASISSLTGIKIGHKCEKIKMVLSAIPNSHRITSGIKKSLNFPPATKQIMIPTDSPFFYIDDNKARVMAVYENSKIPGLGIRKFKDWTSIYCAAPFISREILSGCLDYLRIPRYIETEDIVYANSSLVSVHAGTTGDKQIVFPRRGTIAELFSNKILGKKTRSINCPFKAGETKLFYVK